MNNKVALDILRMTLMLRKWDKNPNARIKLLELKAALEANPLCPTRQDGGKVNVIEWLAKAIDKIEKETK